MLVHVSRESGEWLDSPVDLSAATIVAESRSGATQVWRNHDGQLWAVQYFKSGNVEVTSVPSIPPELTLRY